MTSLIMPAAKHPGTSVFLYMAYSPQIPLRNYYAATVTSHSCNFTDSMFRECKANYGLRRLYTLWGSCMFCSLSSLGCEIIVCRTIGCCSFIVMRINVPS